MIEIKPEKMMEIPDEILSFLQEDANMMHSELPKKFPPRRLIDHKIKLVSGAKSPAQVSYI